MKEAPMENHAEFQRGIVMSKRVLILTGDAVEALEVFYPYYRLLEAEVEAVIAAPSVKKLNTVVHDFVGWDTYTEKPAYLLEAHVAFSDVQPETFDGLILPGDGRPNTFACNRMYRALFDISSKRANRLAPFAMRLRCSKWSVTSSPGDR
ncbi:hypothetical protein GCM10025857_02160 [Alicyclobacillus contaminans]|nr:hypothetical protein GCM10025857_02160 [Alicyclobacillus contaminans]